MAPNEEPEIVVDEEEDDDDEDDEGQFWFVTWEILIHVYSNSESDMSDQKGTPYSTFLSHTHSLTLWLYSI